MSCWEIEAVIEYRVTVDVDGETREEALANFNAGRFREVYLAQAEMINWDAKSRPVEVETP